MKKYTEKTLESHDQNDLEAELKSIVTKLITDIDTLSPKVEALFSDQSFSANHKLVASFKNLEPVIRGNKRVKDQMYSWLIHQMNAISKTIEGVKKTVDNVEQNVK